jgi:hypothetical protein
VPKVRIQTLNQEMVGVRLQRRRGFLRGRVVYGDAEFLRPVRNRATALTLNVKEEEFSPRPFL